MAQSSAPIVVTEKLVVGERQTAVSRQQGFESLITNTFLMLHAAHECGHQSGEH